MKTRLSQEAKPLTQPAPHRSIEERNGVAENIVNAFHHPKFTSYENHGYEEVKRRQKGNYVL